MKEDLLSTDSVANRMPTWNTGELIIFGRNSAREFRQDYVRHVMNFE